MRLRPAAADVTVVSPTLIEALAVSIHTAAGRPLPVRCHARDPLRIALCGEVLERILLNLLRNAGRATSSAGAITVSARRHARGEHVVVAVEDTGSGMTPQELRNLEVRPGRRGRGGIGLVVVRMLVAGSGGAVRLVSRETVGTRVELFFPTAGVSPPGDAADPFQDHEFLSGPPYPLAGGAMLWLHRGPASGGQKRSAAKPWTAIAGMLDNGRASDGSGGAYVV